MKSTNYYSTFIMVADDSPATSGEVPATKNGEPTIGSLQYDKVHDHPYEHTSDDVLFEVYATRQGIPAADRPAEREKFFSKNQPCLRSSPLTKRYGWGIYSDDEGRIALVGVDSPRYRQLSADSNTTQVKAMRSRRA